MKKLIRSSQCIFVVLIIVITFFVSSISNKQYEYDSEKLNNIVRQVDGSFNNILANLYFSVDILEQIAIHHYASDDRDTLDSMFKPMVEAFKYRSISIVQEGMMEYIYPAKDNVRSDSNNILEVQNRVINSEIKTRDVEMSGPYELDDGDQIFIMKKAVFVEEKLWGYVSIVMDKDVLLELVNLKVFTESKYKYQFSSTIDNIDKIVIDETKDFNEKKATWHKIKLANGYWELGIEASNSMSHSLMFVLILMLGYIISFVISYNVSNIEKKLRYAKEQMFIDKLTGANNRKYLDEIQNLFIKNNTTYTVIYIDLNEFKFINDTYGHNVGDEVLVLFTSKLTSIVRDSDYIIRMGGDEFIVILPHISNPIDIQSFCKRLKTIELSTVRIGDIDKHIEFTYGYASSIQNDKSLSEVICDADKSMYVLKNENRGACT